MLYKDYFDMVCDKFPHMNFDMVHWNRVDFVKKVAECLFMNGTNRGLICKETRKQLRNLKDKGILIFDPAVTGNLNGKKVVKKSNKKFKSGEKINTIKSVLINPHTSLPAYSFEEDDSIVDQRSCIILLREPTL